jgi:molecular chaperone DnaJ
MVATSSNDYYELLGVSRDADEKTIKSAYKKAARKYHPDNSETGDEEIFKKVNEAHEVLSDPNKKALYDQYGAEGLKGGAGGFGGGFGGGFSGAAGFEDLGDIFSSFFGQGFGAGGRRSSGPRPTRGEDHTVEVNLKFLDPLSETKKKIKFNPLVTCSSCDGKGAQKPEDVVTCDTCQGVGQVSTVQNTLLGQIRQTTTCPTCRGTGQKIKNPCTGCKGKGQKRENKELEVTVPAGIFDGATLRLGGVGDAGKNGGPPGDIYLYINVDASDYFKREDADVLTEIDIGFAEAALGGEFDIKSLEGTEKLKIKPGVQSAEVFTIKNKGFPVLNNANRRGNYYVKVNVVTPKNLNGEEKKLFKELQKLRNNKDIRV